VKYLFLILVAMLAAAGGWFLRGGPPPPSAAVQAAVIPTEVALTAEAARNFGLATAPAERRPLMTLVRATGMIGFNELRLAHITPLARGRVQSVEVAVGDLVANGARMVVLDALELAEARHNLTTAEAGQRQATAEAQTARASLSRAQDLVRTGALAQSELDRRRADLARAEAAVQTRTVEAEHWREMLARYSPTGATRPGPDTVTITGVTPADALGAILAPFDSTVMAIGATPGELVEPGRDILTLADLSVLWVQANVPERDLGALRVGAPAQVTVAAFPGQRFEGRVARIADQLDARTGTAQVRVELPNPGGLLRVNMFGSVAIETPLGRDGLVVPDAAVQMVDDRPMLFVALGERRFAPREVTLGHRQPGLAEVTQGLEPGEVVATNGSFRLKSLWLRARSGVEE
jgi:cobalt-zinc-cadmium efflux system membrane fusion protein